jgi:PAS domain S-box-containing protein
MLLNPAWEKLLGYSINELLERPFIDFVHPEDRDKTIRVIKENLNNGKSVMQFENRYLTKYGKTIWLEWIAHSSLEDGKIFAIARNISERKHTEALISANERKFRIISEYVSE